MAINPNTDFSSGAVLTAAQQNRFPRGVMAYTAKTTSFAVGTAAADVGVSVTFTAVANRYYRYTAYTYAFDATVASTLVFQITDSANTSFAEGYVRTQGSAQYQEAVIMKVTTETAGTVIRKLRANCTAGTGTIYATATTPIFLVVEDIGPA